jgi:hypothetical protein
MKRLAVVVILAALFVAGCPKIENEAYQMVVASNAFLKSMKAQHPECETSKSALCENLTRAVSAKDALIDAVEIYCSNTVFESGGACQPPAKGTPAATQALAKLQAAMRGYKQAEIDLKGAIH